MSVELPAHRETQKSDDLASDHSRPHTRPTPAIRHIAFLSAFLLPLVVIPYIITRRQISVVERKMNEAAGLTAATLQGDLKRVLLEVAKVKQENVKVRASLREVMLDVEELGVAADRRQTTATAVDDMLRSDIGKLLEERRHTR
jgi:hypothetical protein